MRKRLPHLMPLMLMAADMMAVLMAALAAIGVRLALDGSIPAPAYLRLLPLLALFPLVFTALRLYPGVLLSPPEELKKLSWGVSLVFLTLGAVFFVTKEADIYSRGVFLLAWLLSLVLVPLARAATRALLMRQPWWGYPVVVFGVDHTARILLRTLHLRPGTGLRPEAVFACPAENLAGNQIEDVPVLTNLEDALALGRAENSYAAVSWAFLKAVEKNEMLDRLSRSFRNVLVMPPSMGRKSLWAVTMDVGGLLGLLVRHNLLDGRRLVMKRTMDLVLTLVGGIVALPLCLLIALLIFLESGGPVLFRQKRIGLHGKPFHVLKFRTMVTDAETVLEKCLAENPALLEEWQNCHKLRHDPRVTRMGRLLRMTSLDELPQLVNVLRGELSLVGPRPIVESEKERYRENFNYYTRVKPGITGLWQISGRNLVSYDERIDLDTYYINNWSIWFDIYILAKTIPVVLTMRGAC